MKDRTAVNAKSPNGQSQESLKPIAEPRLVLIIDLSSPIGKASLSATSSGENNLQENYVKTTITPLVAIKQALSKNKEKLKKYGNISIVTIGADIETYPPQSLDNLGAKIKPMDQGKTLKHMGLFTQVLHRPQYENADIIFLTTGISKEQLQKIPQAIKQQQPYKFKQFIPIVIGKNAEPLKLMKPLIEGLNAKNVSEERNKGKFIGYNYNSVKAIEQGLTQYIDQHIALKQEWDLQINLIEDSSSSSQITVDNLSTSISASSSVENLAQQEQVEYMGLYALEMQDILPIANADICSSPSNNIQAQNIIDIMKERQELAESKRSITPDLQEIPQIANIDSSASLDNMSKNNIQAQNNIKDKNDEAPERSKTKGIFAYVKEFLSNNAFELIVSLPVLGVMAWKMLDHFKPELAARISGALNPSSYLAPAFEWVKQQGKYYSNKIIEHSPNFAKALLSSRNEANQTEIRF